MRDLIATGRAGTVSKLPRAYTAAERQVAV
jgi:hypothetical protein